MPPSISVVLLGYTNRVGPYARLAITNRSESPITLNALCRVQYSPVRGSADRQVTSIEASKFRLTRLLPNQGFVQEIFVFPGDGEWQFECDAAYSSKWFATRLSVESWLRKHSRFIERHLAGKAWHQFTTKWFVDPP
jgi:hypothetical protein